MAFSFPQATVHSPVGTSPTDETVNGTLGGAVAVDDIIDVVVGWGNGSAESPQSCTDNLGNTYIEKAGCNVFNATNSQCNTVYACEVTSAGTPTVTVTWATGRPFKSMTITPIRGGSLTGTPPEQGAGQSQSGTTTPSSGNITPGANGALVISSVQDVSLGAVTITPESNNLSNTGGTDGCATQYEIQSVAGSIAGDFTLSASRDTLTTVRSYAVADTGTTGSGGVLVTPALSTTGVFWLLEQEGFRFYNDDGSEAASTAAAPQDTNATFPIGYNLRLRMLVNATGDPPSAGYQLEYRKVGDSTWVKATP